MSTREKILAILNEIDREGVEEMTSYLENSKFFEEPASASNHNAYEGGMADHSLNVYNNLQKLKTAYPELEKVEDSLRIVSLLHEVGYVGSYSKTYKNQPLKDKNGKNKTDERGKIIFVEKASYEFISEAHLPYSKGQLSSMKIKEMMKLTKLEDLVIHWQNGIYDIPQHLWYTHDKALKTHKLIMLFQLAKKEAKLYQSHKVHED